MRQTPSRSFSSCAAAAKTRESRTASVYECPACLKTTPSTPESSRTWLVVQPLVWTRLKEDGGGYEGFEQGCINGGNTRETDVFGEVWRLAGEAAGVPQAKSAPA